jgi:hypothetical protein
MQVNQDIAYRGLRFRVEGDYDDYLPAHISADAEQDYPGEGGDWNEYQIFLGECDVTELLAMKVVNAILEEVQK